MKKANHVLGSVAKKRALQVRDAFHVFQQSKAGLDEARSLFCRFHKPLKQGVRCERLGFQFRMELYADEPRVVTPLNDFGQGAVWGHAREQQPTFFKLLAVLRINFIPVAVALFD